MMAPILASLAAAPPVYAVDLGAGAVPPVMVLLPAMRVKLAQVRRVALLLWITMERLPKKEAGP